MAAKKLKPHSEENPQKEWLPLTKLRSKVKAFIDVAFKRDVDEVISEIEKDEEVKQKTNPDYYYSGGLDEHGREIPDPRPVVAEVKPLTMEQKIINQLIVAHNKAAIERSNLPPEWDLSDPEQMREILDLDIPDEGFNYEELEKELLIKAMGKSNGVVAKAAKLLGMSYKTFWYRWEKFGLNKKSSKNSTE